MNIKNTTITYAVIYPCGTSDSYELFASSSEVRKFLDEESCHYNVVLPDSQLTIISIEGTKNEIERDIYNMQKDDDGEYYECDGADILSSMAIECESVDHWRLHDIWAERDNEGGLTFLDHRVDNNMPEAEEGGEVIEAWSDECEIYDNEEDAISANEPSQYLTKF